MAGPTDLLDPVHCVSHALHRTARRVAGIYADELRTCGLSPGQFPLLQTLAAGGGEATMSELADRLGLDRTTLTRNLGPLEKGGLITRGRDDADARLRRVRLTEEGRDRLAKGQAAWRRAQALTLERFGDDAWRALEADLQRLRRALS